MAAPTEAEINRVIRTKEQAISESERIEAIRMDEQNISGTRYRFRISEEPET